MKRTPTEDIAQAYQETGSIWKAGKRLGISGQTVHERLRAIGYPLAHRTWEANEDRELLALVDQGLPASEIARRLGRTFASVTVRLSRMDVRVQPKRAKKLPRGAGYDKASTLRHMAALEKNKQNVTMYARANGLNVDSVVYALQLHCRERWDDHLRATSPLAEKTCAYCQAVFVPANGKQKYCTRQCADTARSDASYFGGQRRTTVGLSEGVCQLCGRKGTRGLSSHHVFGKENDPNNEVLVALCPGCHKAVTLLGSRTFVDDPAIWEALIALAWSRKNGAKFAAGEVGSIYTYVEVEFELEDEDS